MTAGVSTQQRFNSRQPCPICSGHANMPQGKGMRCYGFLSEDEEFAHCSREDHAGNLQEDSAQTYAHKLHGPCACGEQHGEANEPIRPVPINHAKRKETIAAVSSSRAPDAEYVYVDGSGKPVAIKGRWNIAATVEGEKDDKDIKWRAPESVEWSGLRKYGFGVEDIPLYHADKLALLPPGATVYLVEGEKACGACEDAQLVDWKTSGVTTLAGGAQQTKFGKALEALEGFNLRPWPDNDIQGRKLMRTVRAEVEHIVQSWKPVIVSVPEGGDAYDYFFPPEGSGYTAGTVAEIENATLSKPTLEHLGAETIRVTVPTTVAGMPAEFVFSEVERRRRQINAVVTVAVKGAASRRTLAYDIDLLSITKVKDYRLMLDKAFGDQFEWHDVLTTAINELRTGWAQSSPLVDGADIPEEDDDALQYAVDRIIPWGEHVILFGRRDSTKSYISLMIACCASLGMPIAGLPTNCQGPWLYIDNETNERNWGRRLRRCWKSLGFTPGNYPRDKVFYKNSRGLSMPDMVDDLLPKCDAHGIVGIIQDSAIGAVGGDPLNPQDVIRYCSAVDRFQRTVITIAHIPKDEKNEPDDPFGSIVWSNKVRACLRITKSKAVADQNLVTVTLTPTKGNDLADKRSIILQVSFDGETGAVAVRSLRRQDAPQDAQVGQPIKWRIYNVLQRDAMTAWEICEALNVNSTQLIEVKTVKDTCYQMTRDDSNPRLVQLDQSVGGRGKEVRYGRLMSEGGPRRQLAAAVGQNVVAEEDDLPFG